MKHPFFPEIYLMFNNQKPDSCHIPCNSNLIKLKRLIKYIFVFSLMFLGCVGRESCEESENTSNQITLIFKNIPKENSTYTTKSGLLLKNSHDIFFLEDNLVEQQLFFDEAKEGDTIRINTGRSFTEVFLAFKTIGFQNAGYLFYRGDTVLVTFKGNIPDVYVKNRSYPEFDVNYDVLKNTFISDDGIPAINKFSHPFLFSNIAMWDRVKINQYRDSLLPMVKDEYSQEILFLDSLFEYTLLSKTNYSYRKGNLLSRIYSMSKNGIEFNDHSIKEFLNDTVFYLNAHDSLLYYGYYRNYLSNIVNNRLKDIQPVYGPNGNFADYFSEFDSITSFDFLSEKERKYFLTKKIKNILDEGSLSQIEEYQGKFHNITGDSLVLNQLLKDYNIDLGPKNELLLEDLEGNRTDFNSLLKQHKGKMIYVDFWASWCAPCRKSMPYAEKLRNEYSENDVAFIYLALNDKIKDWKESIPKLALERNCENYFIVNSRTSKFIEAFKVKTIPRYMLFNKKGELVNQNAPGPEGQEIREFLNRYLFE
jgi:thiol-disulfide isomerase/thioredoxin